MTILVYCNNCEWQKVADNIREVWECSGCPDCGDMGVSYVGYEPQEKAQASFVARRQVP